MTAGHDGHGPKVTRHDEHGLKVTRHDGPSWRAMALTCRVTMARHDGRWL